MNNLRIQNVSIKPNGITLYYPSFGNKEKLVDLDNNHNGVISKKSNNRLRNSLDWLFLLSEKGKNRKNESIFLINEITLTLPSKQIHSDDEINRKCLNTFLTTLRQSHNMEYYIRKSEVQKNGNIHYHILTDSTFINKKEIQKIWNRIINALGYVKRYSQRMSKFTLVKYMETYSNPNDTRKIKENRIKRYHKNVSENWQNPPSTRIDTIKDEFAIKDYLRKNDNNKFSKVRKDYLRKNDTDNKRAVTGRVWMVSRRLSKLRGIVLEYPDVRDELESTKYEFIKDDFFTFIKAPILKWYGKLEQMTKYVKDYIDITLGYIEESTGELINEKLEHIRSFNSTQLQLKLNSQTKHNPYEY